MANWSGVTASLIALAKPSTLQPRLSIPSIAHLDWHRLKHEGGVTGIVVDKDNCIAKPQEDDLAPDPALRESWGTLLRTFGPENVLVVSNSAGTLAKDPLLLQAESVSRNLGVPVLIHRAPKPGPACVKQVAAHFLLSRGNSSASSSSSSLSASPAAHDAHATANRGQVVFSPLAAARARSLPPPPPSPPSSSSRRTPRLLVIGDRLATDMILSHRLSRLPLPLSLPSSPSPSSASQSRLKRLLALFRRARNVSLGREGDRIETVAVLTTTLHSREGLGTTMLRAVEKSVLWGLQRAKRRRVSGAVVKNGEGKKGTVKEGAEGARGVEDIEWERFLTTYTAPSPALPSPSLEAATPSAPLPGESLTAAILPSTTSQISPSPSSPPAPSLPLLTRLQSLPTALSHTFSTLPARVQSFLAALPPRALSALRHSLRRLSLRAQVALPRVLASLHGPLSRLVEIYTHPASLASGADAANSREVTPLQKRRATDLTIAWTEKAVERVEERLEGLKGLRALAQARAEELGRLREGLKGLPGLPGMGKPRKEKEGGEVKV
ncbi:hypothetical protein JCM6882_008692 [Rhodosporidiobolus microsporus]